MSKSLKIFTHYGPGHYVGSAIIVCAETLEEAKVVMRETLNECGLMREQIEDEKIIVMDAIPNLLVYADDGDY